MADRGFIDPACWRAAAVAGARGRAAGRRRPRRMAGWCSPTSAFLDLVRWTRRRADARRAGSPVMFPDVAEREIVMREVDAAVRSRAASCATASTVTCGDGIRRVFDLTTTAISHARRLARPHGHRRRPLGGRAMPVGGGERGFEELVEDAPDILLRVDALSGRMLYVNRAIERLTGYTPEEFYRDAGAVRARSSCPSIARPGRRRSRACRRSRRARSIWR